MRGRPLVSSVVLLLCAVAGEPRELFQVTQKDVQQLGSQTLPEKHARSQVDSKQVFAPPPWPPMGESSDQIEEREKMEVSRNTVCVEKLCLYNTPGSEVGLHVMPGHEQTYNKGHMSRDYVSIYLTSLPFAGDLQLRKLWETSTGLVSEHIGRVTGGEKDAHYNVRTRAMAKKCGGIPILSRSAYESAKSDYFACHAIKMSWGAQPTLITTYEPLEVPGWQLEGGYEPLPRVDIHVTLIRNPLDQYYDMFVMLNPKYMKTRRTPDMEWPVSLEQFFESHWEPTVAAATTMMTTERPAYVMRYEDMLYNPKQTLEDFLTVTGAASALSLSASHISAAVAKVETAVRKQKGLLKKTGSGFKECQKLASIFPRNANFFSKAAARGDERVDEVPVARACFELLKSHQALLQKYGYYFFAPAFEPPPQDLHLTARAERQAKDLQREMIYTVMKRRLVKYPMWSRDKSVLPVLTIPFASSLRTPDVGWMKDLWGWLGVSLIGIVLIYSGHTWRSGESEEARIDLEKQWRERLSKALSRAGE